MLLAGAGALTAGAAAAALPPPKVDAKPFDPAHTETRKVESAIGATVLQGKHAHLLAFLVWGRGNPYMGVSEALLTMKARTNCVTLGSCIRSPNLPSRTACVPSNGSPPLRGTLHDRRGAPSVLPLPKAPKPPPKPFPFATPEPDRPAKPDAFVDAAKLAKALGDEAALLAAGSPACISIASTNILDP